MARGYGQYCPVALATEILGERWTMLVILALIDGVARFNDLQRALPRISATTLTQRLRSLEDAGVARKQAAEGGTAFEYVLTDAGRELEPIIVELAYWGQRWARDLEPDDRDPRFLGWSMHLRMNVEAMPRNRTVIEFSFTSAPADCRRFWIISDKGRVEMCIKPPGSEPDLRVNAELARFVDVWRGFRSLREEIAAGKIRLEGPREMQRAFPDWLLLSVAAPVERLRPGRERTTARRIRATPRRRS